MSIAQKIETELGHIVKDNSFNGAIIRHWAVEVQELGYHPDIGHYFSGNDRNVGEMRTRALFADGSALISIPGKFWAVEDESMGFALTSYDEFPETITLED